MKRITALTSYNYGGKRIEKGQIHKAEDRHARLLVTVRKAEYTKDEPAPALQVEKMKPEEAAASQPTRRRYTTRAMKADDAG